MRQSVRCHAVITPEAILKNVIVGYNGDMPEINNTTVTLTVSDVTVVPFCEEVHSTVSYNGIAIVGAVCDMEVVLSASNLSQEIKEIRGHLTVNPSTIQFIPLECIGR